VSNVGAELLATLLASRPDFFWSLQGDFKDMEDQKHMAVYEMLGDSDQKLHYFSGRQIGGQCNILGFDVHRTL